MDRTTRFIDLATLLKQPRSADSRAKKMASSAADATANPLLLKPLPPAPISTSNLSTTSPFHPISLAYHPPATLVLPHPFNTRARSPILKSSVVSLTSTSASTIIMASPQEEDDAVLSNIPYENNTATDMMTSHDLANQHQHQHHLRHPRHRTVAAAINDDGKGYEYGYGNSTATNCKSITANNEPSPPLSIPVPAKINANFPSGSVLNHNQKQQSRNTAGTSNNGLVSQTTSLLAASSSSSISSQQQTIATVTRSVSVRNRSDRRSWVSLVLGGGGGGGSSGGSTSSPTSSETNSNNHHHSSIGSIISSATSTASASVGSSRRRKRITVENMTGYEAINNGNTGDLAFFLRTTGPTKANTIIATATATASSSPTTPTTPTQPDEDQKVKDKKLRKLIALRLFRKRGLSNGEIKDKEHDNTVNEIVVNSSETSQIIQKISKDGKRYLQIVTYPMEKKNKYVKSVPPPLPSQTLNNDHIDTDSLHAWIDGFAESKPTTYKQEPKLMLRSPPSMPSMRLFPLPEQTPRPSSSQAITPQATIPRRDDSYNKTYYYNKSPTKSTRATTAAIETSSQSLSVSRRPTPIPTPIPSIQTTTSLPPTKPRVQTHAPQWQYAPPHLMPSLLCSNLATTQSRGQAKHQNSTTTSSYSPTTTTTARQSSSCSSNSSSCYSSTSIPSTSIPSTANSPKRPTTTTNTTTTHYPAADTVHSPLQHRSPSFPPLIIPFNTPNPGDFPTPPNQSPSHNPHESHPPSASAIKVNFSSSSTSSPSSSLSSSSSVGGGPSIGVGMGTTSTTTTTPTTGSGASSSVSKRTKSIKSTSSSSSRTTVAKLTARIESVERQNRLLEAALQAVLWSAGTLNGCPCGGTTTTNARKSASTNQKDSTRRPSAIRLASTSGASALDLYKGTRF